MGLILISFLSYAEPPNEAVTLQDSFVKVSKDVGPAVVSISTEHTEKYHTRYYPFAQFQDDFFNDFFVEGPERELKKTGLGSGVIIIQIYQNLIFHSLQKGNRKFLDLL